jgi:hypothetical protein
MSELLLANLPLRSQPVYNEELAAHIPVVENNGQITDVFRILADSYDCINNWDQVMLQQKLLTELQDFDIDVVHYTPFVTNDYYGRSRVAALAQYLPYENLGQVFANDPDKARPQIDTVTSRMLDYFEHKFKTGDRFLIDISKFDQYMFAPDGPVLIDIEGFLSYTIEDIREQEDEDSIELAQAEMAYTQHGDAGVTRLSLSTELEFLHRFYKDKVSPEIYSQCCTMKEMADRYVEEILGRKG